MTNLKNAPQTIKTIARECVTELDVRPILKAGGEPFAPIMSAVGNVPPAGALRLRATFEPKPLFRVLGNQGWAHWVEYGDADDWIIWFYRESTLPAGLADVGSRYPELSRRLQVNPGTWVLDVRDLSPPEPMEMTLAVLEYLPANISLTQVNQRIPQFLLPILEAQEMNFQVLQEDENEVRIEIKHR